jgi:hypothetical protein
MQAMQAMHFIHHSTYKKLVDASLEGAIPLKTHVPLSKISENIIPYLDATREVMGNTGRLQYFLQTAWTNSSFQLRIAVLGNSVTWGRNCEVPVDVTKTNFIRDGDKEGKFYDNKEQEFFRCPWPARLAAMLAKVNRKVLVNNLSDHGAGALKHLQQMKKIAVFNPHIVRCLPALLFQ